MTTLETLSYRLKGLRKSNKVLQKTIADDLGLSLRGYQRYERGEREPAASTLVAFARYYDVSIDYLLGRTGNSKVNNEGAGWFEIDEDGEIKLLDAKPSSMLVTFTDGQRSPKLILKEHLTE